jgi:Mu-like prophage protein gp36
MSYSQQPEVLEMIKEDALNGLIGDTFIEDAEERKQRIGVIVDAAIADADGEIDGYLSKRYAVPLSSPPKIINKFSKDIAVYNLFSRLGIADGSEEKNFLHRYNSAIKFLTYVAEGKVSIGVEADDPSAAAAGFAVDSSPRLFRRSSMQGM